MQLMVVLKPILDAAGIERLIVSTYQSVSGHRRQGGRRAARRRRAAVLARRASRRRRSVYPHPIAFNVLGGAGNFKDGDDYTDEERKMMFETRKILEAPDIGISVTCARVPVIAAHSESVNVQTRDADRAGRGRASCCARAPGVEVVDDPASNGYPTALAGAGRDEVLVGRIRRDPSHPRALNLWVVERQPAQGRRHQRDPDRRGAARARPRAGSCAGAGLTLRPTGYLRPSFTPDGQTGYESKIEGGGPPGRRPRVVLERTAANLRLMASRLWLTARLKSEVQGR